MMSVARLILSTELAVGYLGSLPSLPLLGVV
jgi:hypothetical protein